MVMGVPSVVHDQKRPNPARLLSMSEREELASKDGERKTVFFSKKNEITQGGYVRTGQYLGEWKANKYDGKGTLEADDGTRYVGEWRAGRRNGMGTLWIRRPNGKLYKQYAGSWKDDFQDGRGAHPSNMNSCGISGSSHVLGR